MDAPRKWQVASMATAVASMSMGALLLARPTSEAVAPIELDAIADGRELSVASPSDAVGATGAEDGNAPRIVTPEVPSSFAEVDADPTPPDTPDATTTRSGSPTEPVSPPDVVEREEPDDDVDPPDDDDDDDDDLDAPDDDNDDARSIDSP